MKTLTLVAITLLATTIVGAEPVIPTADGTTWMYESVDELGGPAAAPPSTTSVAVKAGRQTFDGKDFLKFETAADEVTTRTELMTLDDRGLVCHFRAGKDGRMARLDPPQTILPAAPKNGDAWESDGEVAGIEIRQRFRIVGDELVRVPAGAFRALRIHCEDASVMSITLDRWFVSGIGFVKETTVVRGPTGGLLQRTTLELQRKPEVVTKPQATPTPSASPQSASPPADKTVAPSTSNKRLIVDVSPDPAGGMKTEFKSDVQNIYVRWRGNGLPEGARVRVAWIAEDVGDLVQPNFVVDETESVAPAPDASAKFTLGRPPDGWAEGKYRVEFYVNDELEETVRVIIK